MHLGLGSLQPLSAYTPLEPRRGLRSDDHAAHAHLRPEQASAQAQLHGLASLELVEAVQHGRLEEIEELLRRKRMVDSEPEHPRISSLRDKDGCTLLHWAAANNRTAIATLLIDDGAEVDAAGGELGETPLLWACRSGEKGWGHTQMVALLLAAGADVNKQGKHGNNALFVAVSCRSVQIALQLLAERAGPGGPLGVNSTNPHTGDTALLSLLKNFEDRCYDGKPKELARLLLSWGADVHQADSGGNTALHLLARAPPEDMDLGLMFTIAELARTTKPPAHGSSAAASTAADTASSSMCSFLDRRNFEGCTAAQEAEANPRAGHSIINFLEQYWLYCKTPASLPIFNFAVLTFLLPVLLQQFHYVGFLVWGPFFACALWTDQTKIPEQKSKSAYGFAWGNIAAIWHGFYLHSSAHLPVWVSWAVVALVLFVLATLSITRMSNPAFLPRGRPGDVQVQMLAGRLAAHGSPDGMVDSHRNYSSRISASAAPATSAALATPAASASQAADGKFADNFGYEAPRLCATCLTDRSMASTHCSECDCCRLALDHHCPFVNNCVGRGNRRVFVMFCGGAAVASSTLSLIGLMVQYNGHICVDVPFLVGSGWDMFVWPFSIQWCVLSQYPAFALVVYIGFISAGWTGSLCYYQLEMVAHETTTYEQIREMKRKYDAPYNMHGSDGGKEKGPVAAHGGSQGITNWRRSLSNVWRFCKTGHFTITRRGQGAQGRPAGGGSGPHAASESC